jgi:transcriptional regulator with XRE-family HTH domain
VTEYRPTSSRQKAKPCTLLWKKRARRTQAAFAADCGFTQGYLPQFFAGLRPLTLNLANQFADELGVEIAEFSPRLAQAFHDELEATQWPFTGFTRAQYLSLTPGQRIAIEAAVVGHLIDNGTVNTRTLRPMALVRKTPKP